MVIGSLESDETQSHSDSEMLYYTPGRRFEPSMIRPWFTYMYMCDWLGDSEIKDRCLKHLIYTYK